jgi:hypothetical protein
MKRELEIAGAGNGNGHGNGNGKGGTDGAASAPSVDGAATGDGAGAR